MFIAALFRVAKKCKKPKCPSPDEWLTKICYSPKMEYYLATKRMKNTKGCGISLLENIWN